MGKYVLTNGSRKTWGTLMSSTILFRKRISKIFVNAFLLALDIGGWKMLDWIMMVDYGLWNTISKIWNYLYHLDDFEGKQQQF